MLYALHGFLGLPSDWEDILPSHSPLDIYEYAPPSEDSNLHSWASSFNEKLKPKAPATLLGYSLGGRLAMHALIHDPFKWNSAVIISAHTGLNDPTEKQKRIAHDLEWAKKFEKNEWQALMSTWNAQPAFKHSQEIVRCERDYSRELLSNTLRYWSLGHQDAYGDQICNLPIPILWIAGEKDRVYVEQACQMKLRHPLSQVWIAPEVGHRVPWSCKNSFQNTLSNFLRGIQHDDKGATLGNC